MRRTLARSYLVLMVLLLVALEGPLLYEVAMDKFQHLLNRRSTEAASLAAYSEPVLAGNASVEDFRERVLEYAKRQHASVLLLDATGRTVAASSLGLTTSSLTCQADLGSALAGGRPAGMDYPINLRALPLCLVQPVQDGGRLLGVLATVSPTTDLRACVARYAVGFAAFGLLALAAAFALSARLSRWVLCPVRGLSVIALSIADGQYEERAPADDGPRELQGLAAAVNTMADRLVTLLEAQRAFVADACHQLRNPLTVLRLRVEALESVIVPHGREDLAVVVAEAERLSSILEELLVLAKAETSESCTEAVDANAVAACRAAAWQARADEHMITIMVEGDRATVAAVPGTLDQTLDVLIDNAVGVSPYEGGVTVSVANVGDRVEVHVVDTGPGMPAEDRVKAFDRFWRGTTHGDRDGFGLGLSIALALVTSSGGELRLDAASPHGVDAVLTLPAAPAFATA